MIIYDQNMDIIKEPDFTVGTVEEYDRLVTFEYIITSKEEGHYKTIAEYPNGGKDVAWIIDTPEEGRWVSFDVDGNEIETELTVPDDAAHDVKLEEVEAVGKYRLYTPEELAEIERLKKEEEEAAAQPTTSEILDVLLGTGGEA